MTTARSRWITRYELLLFFVLTYAITITANVVSRYLPGLPMAVWWVPQVFSPTISAIILTGISGGAGAVKRLLLRLGQWKVGASWYLAAFALAWVPLLLALGYMALGYTVRGLAPGMTTGLLLYSLLYNVYAGPLAEEAGWRGFALPRLQARFSALTSSLILGVLWACWHLPFYIDSGARAGIPFPAYLALTTVLAIFITWIYNNASGSLLLCVLAHFSFNAGSAFIVDHLGLLPRMVFNIGCSVALLALVVAIVLYYGPGHLSKKAAEPRRLAS